MNVTSAESMFAIPGGVAKCTPEVGPWSPDSLAVGGAAAAVSSQYFVSIYSHQRISRGGQDREYLGGRHDELFRRDDHHLQPPVRHLPAR